MKFNLKKFFSVISPLLVLSLLFAFPQLKNLLEESGYTQVLGTQDEPNFELALVERVIDGDTIELSDGRKVRYIGVDTPETKHPSKAQECYGQEASEFNQGLVEGQVISLEKDVSEVDKYGRLLRYVYLEDLLVNQELVEKGYALSSSYLPDIKYQGKFLEAERRARRNNLGFWGVCDL